MTMNHPYINRTAFDFDYAPGKTARILDAIRSEKAVIQASPRDSLTARVAAKNVATLEELYEKSKRNDAARYQLHADIKAKQQAQHDAVEERKRAALVDQLRTAYLESPGTTEAGFEKALPELLEQRARDAALRGEAERDRALATAKASGRYSL